MSSPSIWSLVIDMTTGSVHLPRFHSLSRPKSQGWEMGAGRRSRTEVSQRTLLGGEEIILARKATLLCTGHGMKCFYLAVFSRSVMSDSATSRTVACQAPLSMEFSKQEYEMGCHFHLQGIFLTQGSNSGLLHWQSDPLPLSRLGSPFSGYKPSMLLIV